MDNKVGIGVIGTGFARRVQIPAFRTCPNAEIVSVASASLENARGTAEEFGIGHFSDDWRETALHVDVHLVCITTPPKLHREMVLFALEHGKHVLCEKPMAMNVAEAEEMADAARLSSRLAIIDHELRFLPGRRVAREMLGKGAIGEVRHAKAIFQAPHRGDPAIPWNWWSDAEMGGGALGAIGSHIIDSFHWFLGAAVTEVFCQLHAHIRERADKSGTVRAVTADDQANMILRFDDSDLVSGATGLVSISMTESPGFRNRVEFYGPEGTLRVDHRGEVFLAKTGDTGFIEIAVDLGAPVDGVADTGFSRGFMSFAPSIIDAIRNGRNQVDEAATFEDGLRVQRVLDASRESSSLGKTLSIGETDRFL